MKTEVVFAFSIDQKVKTMFGDIGYVKSLTVDDTNCNKVYVQRSSDSAWFKENELESVD